MYAALLALLAAAPAAQPPRPPDGTYTYAITASGKNVLTSTVTVSSADSTFTVSEQTVLPTGAKVTVRTAYDSATLLPTHYEVHTRPAVANADLMASVTPRAITFDGLPLAFQASGDAAYIVIGEGLTAYRMMMPWTIAANANRPFTFAALNGVKTLPASVVAATAARPAGVAATDQALAAHIGNDTVTYWFNPQTRMTDAADSGAVLVSLQRYDPHVTTLAVPSAVVHVPLAAAHYTESNISIPSTGGAVLSGTLSLPHGTKRFPIVIMVHGSGPGTRDGGTQANPTFLLLANALANHGVAVLRYDKRGIGSSTGTATEDWHPLADDVRAATAFAKRLAQIDPSRVYVLGHSEGGLVVPLAANSLGERGIILMAPPSIPLSQILVKQGLNDMTPAQQKALTDAFAPYVGIEPGQVIAQVNVPVLMLQGGKDGQVLASDFARMLAGLHVRHHNVTAVVFPEDDHLFITLPATQATQAGELAEPHPLDPRVAQTILSFIKGTP